MPIYEYRCAECKFQEEYLQKVSESPLSVCPSCGKQSFNKLLSAAGFQLKGSGWYATDFRNKGTAPAASGDKPAANGDKPAGSGEKATGNGDGKSATTKDAGGESDSKKAGKSETAASTSVADS